MIGLPFLRKIWCQFWSSFIIVFSIWSFNVVLIEVFGWWFVSIKFLCDYLDLKKYFIIGLMVAFYKSNPLLLFERNWKWKNQNFFKKKEKEEEEEEEEEEEKDLSFK
jgi:hypothetical protein